MPTPRRIVGSRSNTSVTPLDMGLINQPPPPPPPVSAASSGGGAVEIESEEGSEVSGGGGGSGGSGGGGSGGSGGSGGGGGGLSVDELLKKIRILNTGQSWRMTGLSEAEIQFLEANTRRDLTYLRNPNMGFTE
jgi:hypothetical protein